MKSHDNYLQDYPSAIVADIGGTHARFAICIGTKVKEDTIQTLLCNNYAGLADALQAYLASQAMQAPASASIAVATYVDQDQIKLTNRDWSFSITRLAAEFALQRVKVINDFTALALSLPHLPATACLQIGPGDTVAEAPLALIGPGTGLGVSGLIFAAGYWHPLASEGGHVTCAAMTEEEAGVINYVRKTHAHVSAERLLSGSGIVNLYKAIAAIHGGRSDTLESHQIAAQGLTNSCPYCARTLAMFCALLGTTAGNLVLTLGAKGGVYIGGGIVPSWGDYLSRSDFRQRFEQHGRFSDYLAAVPSFIVPTGYQALLGAAVALDSCYAGVGLEVNNRSEN